MNTKQSDEFGFLRGFAADPASKVSATTTIRAEARLEQILAMEQTDVSRGFDRLNRRVRGFETPLARLNPGVLAKLSTTILWGGSRWDLFKWAAIPVAVAAGVVGGIYWPGTGPQTPGAPALIAESENPGAPAILGEPQTPDSSVEAWLAPPTIQAALASWTPVSSELTAEQITRLEVQCRNELEPSAASLVASVTTLRATEGRDAIDMDRNIGDLLVSERRGDWAFLVFGHTFVGANGEDFTNNANCLIWFRGGDTNNPAIAGHSFSTNGASTGSTGLGDGSGLSATAIVGGSGLQDSAGNWVEDMWQFGASWDQGSAFTSLIGKVPNAANIMITTDDGEVTPTVTGDWFVAWWPVTQSVGTLDTQAGTVLAPLVFAPALRTLTVTDAHGDVIEYAPAFSPTEAIYREATPDEIPAGSHVTTIRNDPAETGIMLPQLFLSGEQVTLPTETASGFPITWTIDPLNNPNGAILTGSVLDVGQASLFLDSPEALVVVANVAVGDVEVPIHFTVHVITPEMLAEWEPYDISREDAAFTRAEDVAAFHAAIAEVSTE